MKITRTIFIVIIILFILASFAACSSPKKKLIAQIDYNIESLEDFIDLSNMQIELKPGVQKPLSEFDDGFEDIDTVISKEKLQKFFDEREVYYNTLYPYGLIKVDNDHNDLQKLLGKGSFYFMENKDYEPIMTPLEIKFRDGTSMQPIEFTNADLIWQKYKHNVKFDGETYEELDNSKMSDIELFMHEENSSSKDEVLVYSPKDISSAKFRIDLPLAETKIYYAKDSNDVISTPEGDIKMEGISGNQIAYNVPGALKERVKPLAFFEDGRILESKGNNSHSVFSKDQIKILHDLIAAFKLAKEKVKSDEIKDEKELAKFIETKVPQGQGEVILKAEYMAVEYTYSRKVSRVGFLVEGKTPDTLTFYSNYKFKSKDSTSDYHVAEDFKSRKYGILSNSGKWLVEPRFDDSFRAHNKYYFWDQIDEKDDTYHFDPTTNKLTKVNYSLNEREIFNGKYVEIEGETNGPIGVADAITGKIVLPIEHDYLRYMAAGFWEAEKNNLEGIYDRSFKVVLPFIYDRIDFENGEFHTERNNNTIEEVFNKSGKKIK